MADNDASIFQPSFLGGEWSPLAQGRADTPEYRRALGICLNAIPIAEGAWTRRGGFLSFGATHLGLPGIIRPFTLPDNTPAYLEFVYQSGSSHLYVWVPNADATAFVRMTAETRTISSISAADPALVTVTASESWVTGDDVVVTLAPSSAIGPASALQAQQRELVITVASGTTFTIADAVTNTGIDGSALAYTSSGSDTVSKILSFPLPYTTLAAVQAIRVVKADNLAVLFSPGYPPVTLYYEAGAFALTSPTDVTILDGPYMDPLVGAGAGQLGVSTGHVNANWGVSVTQFTIDDGSYTFTANDVGKLLRLWNQPPLWDDTFDYFAHYYGPAGGNGIPPVVTYLGSYWAMGDFSGPILGGGVPVGTAPGSTFQTTVKNVTTTHIPWIPAPGTVARWLIAKITSVVSGTTVGISFITTDLQTYPTDGSYRTCDMWQLGLIGGGKYPTSGAYRQGRLYVGGAQLNRADMSVADALDTWQVDNAGGVLPKNSFSPTDQYGNVGDANGIAAIMNDAELNNILWFTPVKAGMIAGTPGGEFLIDSSNLNDGLTPATTKAEKVSQHKCANVEPLRIGPVTVFVQRAGRELLEYFADAFTGQPVGRVLNEFSKHLSSPSIAEIHYQHERVPIIWMRTAANHLNGCTYRRLTTLSSQPPEFAGCHRHTHGGGYAVESICAGITPDGLSDCLMAIVNIGGVRRFEMLTNIFDEGDALPNAMHVDGAVVAPGSDNNSNALTLYGLNRYSGSTVSVWLAGLDCGDYLVSTSGTVSIPYGAYPGGTLSAAALNALSGAYTYGAPFDVWISGTRTRITIPCVVGLTYTSQGQTLRPLAQDETKTRSGEALAMTRRSHMFGAYVINTVGQGISFGPDFANLQPVAFTVSLQNPTPLTAAQMYTGVYQDGLNDDYSFDGMLAWQITRPYPATVGAVTTFAQTQER